MKDSFVFYRDWLNVMEQLPAEIQLELYQAVAQYALNGKTPTLSPMAKIAFGFIQQTLDRDEDKYHKTVVSSKVSGRMGNLKRWHKDLYQKVLKGALSLEDAEDIAQAMKKSPPDKKNRPPKNLSLNDNVNDNVNDNDNDLSFLEKKKQKSDAAVSDFKNENSESPLETLQAPKEQSGGGRKRFTIPTPEEVQAYCNERNNGILGQQFCDFYSAKGWKIGSQPMKDWKAAVRTWEMRRKDQSPSITQPQLQISAPKRIRFDEYGNEVVY